MKVFLVHRFSERKSATRLLKKVAKEQQIDVTPFIMDSSNGEEWKLSARSGIGESEAIVVFNNDACLKSTNATWEIDVAKELNKPLIFFDATNPDKNEIEKLYAIYHHDLEFDSYFKRPVRVAFHKKDSAGKEKDKDAIELYKTMVASSEQLIQRRQTMNAFFIAAIGSLLAFAGALVKFGNIDSKPLSFVIVELLGLTGLVLSNSWRILIENYGRLNKAKFRVIWKLEEALPARIFSAEWAALGKGFRPGKYRSFTATEKNVPLGFAVLITLLLILSDVWYVGAFGEIEKSGINHVGTPICNISVNVENQQKKTKQITRKQKGCTPQPG